MREPPGTAVRFESMDGDPLVELLDEGQASAARAARARERDLRRSTEEGAELAPTLLDLAEHVAQVGIATVAGRRHHGVIEAVGGDYCVMRTSSGSAVHLRLDAITTVRPHAGERHGSATGASRSTGDLRLVEVLGRHVGDRCRVNLVLPTGEAVSGELLSVGANVATLRLDGSFVCYVAVANVVEAVIEA